MLRTAVASRRLLRHVAVYTSEFLYVCILRVLHHSGKGGTKEVIAAEFLCCRDEGM